MHWASAIHALIGRAEDLDDRCTALSGHCNISRHVAYFTACPSLGGGMRLGTTARVSVPRPSPPASVSATSPDFDPRRRKVRRWRGAPTAVRDHGSAVSSPTLL